MITPDDIRDPKRKSGFRHVRVYDPTKKGRGHGGGNPFAAESNVGGRKHVNRPSFYGPRRRTAIEAAQDYCDYINGTAPAPTTLKTAGHKTVKSNKPAHPKRVEAYRLLREAAADEGGDPSGFVYLITDGTAVKIGKSADDPQNRLKGLQTGNPRLLVLLGYKEVEDRAAAEAALHAKFHALNVLGEWFKPTAEIFAEFGVAP